MADLFCDHGAYASALGATPTWGVPQDGDGSSKDASTAASIGSVLFGSVPTSGTITVCGASVSTTGVLAAASVAAAADALAANINATTNAVSTTFANTGCPTNANQLRNIVFARGPSGGAPAGTCQIMSRFGSATHNATAIAHTFNGTPTVSQFTGGVGGCWGTAINPAALGVASSIAARDYGTLHRRPVVGTVPSLTNPVWQRTGGGASKSIAMTFAGNINLQHAGFSKKTIFDTNTKWTGDSALGQLRLVITGTVWNETHYFILTPRGFGSVYQCLREKNFEIEFVSSTRNVLEMMGTDNNQTDATLLGVSFVDSCSDIDPLAFFAPFSLNGSGGSSKISLNCYDVHFKVTTHDGPKEALSNERLFMREPRDLFGRVVRFQH
jgi:hypothetical protein